MRILFYRFKNKKSFQSIATICAVFIFVFSFASVAQATLFDPGATLEPDCPPTESLLTCGVKTGVSAGGTGFSVYNIGDILYASATSTLAKLGIGTDGQVLKVLGGVPTWSTGTSANIGDTDLTLTSNRTLTLDGKSLTLAGNTGSIVLNDNGSLTLGDGTNITFTKNSISTADSTLSLKSNGLSTGTIQIGTGGAGTATPDIFALDVKSTAGDPSGFDGAMYFNADSGDFRCYEEGSWNDCVFHPTDSGQNLTLARIGNSTYSTLQDLQNVFHSAGYTSGGDITDAGGETVNIAAGTGLLRSSNTAVATISYMDWGAVSGISIPTNSTRYIGIEYNGGSPQISVRTSSNWNLKTDFSLGVVVNENGLLHIFSDKQAVGDHAANMVQRDYETMPLEADVRNGGLDFDETGTRNVTLSEGAIWDRLNRYSIPTINTNNSDTFDAYYMDGSGSFTKVPNLTQWPNTKYDDGSGTLANLTDGNYGVLWFYLDTNAKISMVYGMDEYTTAGAANSEMAPMGMHLPERLKVFGKLIGKIVFQKSASSAESITSLIGGHSSSSNSSGGVTNHAGLTDLDYEHSGHTGFANSIAGVNDNITSATGLTSITPGAALTITAGGASVWSTSSGTLTIDSASALNLGTTNATSINIGKAGVETTINGGLKVVGNYVTPRGTPITTTGTLNNLVLSEGSYYHYEGNGVATITGIAGGVDGREVHIFNDSGSDLTISHLNGNSLASNRIETPTGEDITIVPNLMIGFIYDSQTNIWHLDTLPSTREGISSYAFLQSGNAYGATATLGTTDAYGLNFITGGNTRFNLAAGGATLTGTGATTLTTNDTLTLSSASAKALNVTSGTTGALTLDSGSTGDVNLGTGANAKTITLGNITGVTALNINTGTGGSTYTTTNGIFNLNTGTGGINLGTDAVAKNIVLGNVTGATTVNVNSGSGGINLNSSSGLRFNPFGASAGNTTEARFAELDNNGTNYVGFKAPDVLAGNVIWTLPVASGTDGQVLTTDSSNNLSWASAGACPTCVVNTSKFTVDANGNITKLNNITTSFPSAQGGSGTVLTNDGTGGLTWSPSGAGSAALSGVSAASNDVSIGNGNNNVNWNWDLSSTTNGFDISETSASSGTGYLQRISTLATSTAKPFSLGARGTTIFDTTAGGGIILGNSSTLNTPITLQSGTGAINIGADAVAHTITIGNTTGATALNLNSGSGGINFGGNTTVSGSNTFTTGTGLTTINSTTVTLAGNSTVIDMTGTGALGLNTITNRAINTGTGTFSTGGDLTVSGTGTVNGSLIASADFLTPFALKNYTVTGSQNDVDLGSGSVISYTGAGTATFTGFTGGVDGKQVRLINNSSSNSSFTLEHENTGSVAGNRILIGSGLPIVISKNNSVTLLYDAVISRWRLVQIPASPAIIGAFGFLQNGNAFGTDASLGTTDANALKFITGGTTRFTVSSGSNTLTGNGATSITTSSGALTLDATTALNLGTSSATSVAIGRTGVTTTNNGSLTSTQTLTASDGLTLTTGALNLTATSGVLDIGSTVLAGASPLVFEGATADAFETTFAFTDPTADRTITFPNNSITINAAADITGTTLASNVVRSSLTVVGALSDGTIASGFGSISTTNNITTSANISSTGSGTITSGGALTASNGLTLTTGALNLTATSGVLDIGSTVLVGASPLVFEGSTADAFETTFAFTDPTADRTITFPNNSITINAAADITGTTLASNVVTSSLTTVGALTAGSIASGFTSINGTPIGASSASTGRFTTLTSTGATDIANAGASNVTIATTGTGNVTIGNSTGTFSITSNGGLNVTSGGALTGVASINTITASATGLTFAGAGTISSTTSSAITLDSGTTGIVNIGTGNNAKTINIGTGTAGNAINIGSNNTVADTIVIGSVLDSLTINSTGLKVSSAGVITGATGITSSGTINFSSLTSCSALSTDNLGNVLCSASGLGPDTATFTDNTALPNPTDTTTLEMWNDATRPNITPINASQTVLVSINVKFTGNSTADQDIAVRIVRKVGGAPASTDTQVGIPCTVWTTNGTDIQTASCTFLDSPSTTSQTFYSVFMSTDSVVSAALTNSVTVSLVVLGADLAENYFTKDPTLSAGDLVSMDPEFPQSVVKSSISNNKNTIGVISSAPSITMYNTLGASNYGKALPVALVGRIPVKVSTENGDIRVGDYLTLSSIDGVAMKSNGSGTVIGQAMSDYSGEGVGVVVAFIKNFEFTDNSILLGDISPKANSDGSDNGLSALVSTVSSEDSRDAGLIIGKKINDGKEFLTDFISARVTAIRGYFDEIFTKKIHTEQLCVKKSDGGEVCVTGDQLDAIFPTNNTVVSVPASSQSVVPDTVQIPEVIDQPVSESDLPVEPTVDVQPAQETVN